MADGFAVDRAALAETTKGLNDVIGGLKGLGLDEPPEPVNLNEATAPAVRLPGCHLPGLTARQLQTSGDLELRQTKFTASSEVNLLSARIGGALDLRGARMANPGGRALWADGITVGNNLLCWERFTALGEVQLRGARIGGVLNMRGASLANPGGSALRADRITVDHNIDFSGGFKAVGDVTLTGARINGQLHLEGASLSNPRGLALAADRVTIDEDLICSSGFTAEGEVRLSSASIGRNFDLEDATLSNPGGCALTLNSAKVAARLSLRPRSRPDGWVDLSNAEVGLFDDDPASWPEMLDLKQFRYEVLVNSRVVPRRRLQWLDRHRGGYVPQLYDQLADVYRRAGDDTAARKIAIAKQRRRRRPYSPLSWVWYLTVGYGYRTWQALIWDGVMAAAGSLVFSGAYPAHMIALTSRPPAFQPVIYTLDVMLPVMGLGQKSAWQPTTATLLYWSWALNIIGSVLSAAVVAGLTGIFKRD